MKNVLTKGMAVLACLWLHATLLVAQTGLTYSVIGSDEVSVAGKSTVLKGDVTVPATTTLNGKVYRVTMVAHNGFKSHMALKSIVLPEGITRIGDKAFCGCTALTKVTLPSTLEKIGSEVFYGCGSLKTIQCYAKNPPEVGLNCFVNVKKATMQVPAGSKSAYDSSLWRNGFVIQEFAVASVESISLSPTTLEMHIGENAELTVAFSPSDVLYKGLQWESSDESVATVSKEGEVTAVGAGAAIITVTSTDNTEATSQCEVSVVANIFSLTYVVDGEEYKSLSLEEGEIITPENIPTKEGYTFSGWSEIPTTMPAHDVTVTGTFTVNKYNMVYMVDGAEFKVTDVEYGTSITPEAAPEKEGYTFSGWSEIPETMPAHDVTVTGTFTVNKYNMVYMVDGAEYKSSEVEYGTSITPEAEPEKEGYTFFGWSEIPETMPAHDVTVTGSFSVNKYNMVYMVDGTEYKSSEVEYGTSITPEAEPEKEGYTFFGWSEIPETMPAQDVTVTASYTTGIRSICLTQPTDVYTLTGNKVRTNTMTLKGLPRGVYVVNGRKVVVE